MLAEIAISSSHPGITVPFGCLLVAVSFDNAGYMLRTTNAETTKGSLAMLTGNRVVILKRWRTGGIRGLALARLVTLRVAAGATATLRILHSLPPLADDFDTRIS